jgi:transcriptional regulator with XRE-family HTH domain
MEELEAIVSENLTALRKAKHLTQQELAEKIGYSDKSISKWELGKAVPAVDILKEFSEFYGVSVDFLITAQSPEDREKAAKGDQAENNNHIIITAMVATFVWFTAACVYASSILNNLGNWWVAFIWAIPVSVFTTGALIRWYWGRTVDFVICESLFIWTILTAFCVQFYFYPPFEQLWYIYLVGVPLQVGVILLRRWK